jgi:1,2-diacylglycerol 3-beta-galactosyltransferase
LDRRIVPVSALQGLVFVDLAVDFSFGKRVMNYFAEILLIVPFAWYNAFFSLGFQNHMDKLYVASDRLYRLARRRGGAPDEKIVMTGLPIRHDFALQSERLGDRTSEEGKAYQAAVREELGLDPKKPMILLMGGGEGVGSLSKIVDALYRSLVLQGVDATICVVCGRNEKLQNELDSRDWGELVFPEKTGKRRRLSHLPVLTLFRRRRSRLIQQSLEKAAKLAEANPEVVQLGKVNVIGLGFVSRMAEYMVAADVLVSKAGPGTIAEAASVGLPILLTSFLPGQEAGNVDFVLDNGFGDFNQNPVEIADEVTCWIKDPSLLKTMSHRAKATGRPHAAAEIVRDICSTASAWMNMNSLSQMSSYGLQA